MQLKEKKRKEKKRKKGNPVFKPMHLKIRTAPRKKRVFLFLLSIPIIHVTMVEGKVCPCFLLPLFQTNTMSPHSRILFSWRPVPCQCTRKKKRYRKWSARKKLKKMNFTWKRREIENEMHFKRKEKKKRESCF